MNELKRITLNVHVICSFIAYVAFGLVCLFGSGVTNDCMVQVEQMVLQYAVFIFSGAAWQAGVLLLMFLRSNLKSIPLMISTVAVLLLWFLAIPPVFQ